MESAVCGAHFRGDTCDSQDILRTESFGWRCKKHYRAEIKIMTSRLEPRIREDPEHLTPRGLAPEHPLWKIFSKVVAAGLRINADRTKTCCEIILECNLSHEAATNTFKNSSLFDPTNGSFAWDGNQYMAVLSSIWNFIKRSQHKEELSAILRSELEEHINIRVDNSRSSLFIVIIRLCSVLLGYMDAIIIETQLEKLQRMMAEIHMSNSSDKVSNALRLLKEFAVPSHEWGRWLENI